MQIQSNFMMRKEIILYEPTKGQIDITLVKNENTLKIFYVPNDIVNYLLLKIQY